MKRTGANLIRYALEQMGITHTFGIPGVHVTELYDELNASESITPVLVTHEGGGSFMAEAISRTSDNVGTLVVVPAAGLTHAMSGIGEAFLDGVPLLVIAGGTRRDTGFSYQLHQMDQQRLLQPITKGTFEVTKHNTIVQTLYDAYNLAIDGEPGPVFVEIPVEIQLFKGEVSELPVFRKTKRRHEPEQVDIDSAMELLRNAKLVGLFAGWGARQATEELVQLAELMGAPVATSLQGLSVFPANHPLHTGMSFGRAAVPAAENAFKKVDCLMAVGVRFGEIGTGSFGVRVPENLIHIDINPDVFNKNYPAKVILACDAKVALRALIDAWGDAPARPSEPLKTQILEDKQAYRAEWLAHDSKDRVNPQRFFDALREALDPSAFMVVDDGNHTFLAAELFPVAQSTHFISPTDFNCMGYAVPASVGVKLVNPDNQVVAIVGDGAFMMTCMELVTAKTLGLGVAIFVFNDGELSQISQGQEIPYNRKTCTVLGQVNYEGVAMATGATYVPILDNESIEEGIQAAVKTADGGLPVVCEVRIDYSKRSRFTQGIVKTNLSRFPLKEKVRFISRALKRKITG
ncbi:MAG: thiamine pyrophosphate-binding protein [Acidobacteria bacterium]|nr:thiamine pyrophosphate-binding protein [Acidobacteriota bacterium]